MLTSVPSWKSKANQKIYLRKQKKTRQDQIAIFRKEGRKKKQKTTGKGALNYNS